MHEEPASRTASGIPALEAEGEGFEPSVQGLPTQRFSRPPDSTTLAPLRGDGLRGASRGPMTNTATPAAAHPRRLAPSRDAHVLAHGTLVRGAPRHPRLHHIRRTDHSSTNP